MSLTADSLAPSIASKALCNTDTEIVDGLFDVRHYESGTVIAKLENNQSENFSILAQGAIKVKIKNNVGESTIRIVKPGETLKLEDMAGLPTIEKGEALQNHATLYAEGETKVLSLNRIKFESMVKFQPEIMYHVFQSMVRSVNEILQSMNSQNEELKNYIYGMNGRH